jgi:hypothetical protein
VRAGHRPIASTVQPPFGHELGASITALTDELPRRAFHEQLALRELHRVYDRTHVMPPFLLGAPPRMLGFDCAPGARLVVGRPVRHRIV